jgi:hypothetical protein
MKSDSFSLSSPHLHSCFPMATVKRLNSRAHTTPHCRLSFSASWHWAQKDSDDNRVRNQHHAQPAINVRRSAAATVAFDRTHDHGAADDAVPQPIRLHTRFGVLPSRVCHMPDTWHHHHLKSTPFLPSALLLLHRVTEPCMSESSERHVAHPNPTITVIYVIQLYRITHTSMRYIITKSPQPCCPLTAYSVHVVTPV